MKNPPTQSNATHTALPKAYVDYLDRRECPPPALWREALQACLDSGRLAPLTPNTIKLVRDALIAADDNARRESELRLENVKLRAKIGGLRAALANLTP